MVIGVLACLHSACDIGPTSVVPHPALAHVLRLYEDSREETMWVRDAINFCEFPMVFVSWRQMFMKTSNTLDQGFTINIANVRFQRNHLFE